MNCKYCQNILDEQGGCSFICHKCPVWFQYDKEYEFIRAESFNYAIDNEYFSLTINYEDKMSHLYNIYGDTIWEKTAIISVNPDNVIDKIKMILLFL